MQFEKNCLCVFFRCYFLQDTFLVQTIPGRQLEYKYISRKRELTKRESVTFGLIASRHACSIFLHLALAWCNYNASTCVHFNPQVFSSRPFTHDQDKEKRARHRLFEKRKLYLSHSGNMHAQNMYLIPVQPSLYFCAMLESTKCRVTRGRLAHELGIATIGSKPMTTK